MSSCTILGGGRVGELLAQYFIKHGRFDKVVRYDIDLTSIDNLLTDLQTIKSADWIFNLTSLDLHPNTDHNDLPLSAPELDVPGMISFWAASINCRNLFVAAYAKLSRTGIASGQGLDVDPER